MGGVLRRGTEMNRFRNSGQCPVLLHWIEYAAPGLWYVVVVEYAGHPSSVGSLPYGSSHLSTLPESSNPYS